MTKKVALVTGVSREMGLGFETAKQLLDVDFNVILSARNLDKATKLAARIGATGRQLDVTNEQSVNQLSSEIEQKFGKLDVLVNNAGAYFDQGGQALEADMQFVKDALDTNLLGAWRVSKAFIGLLQKSDNGRIVNVSSGAGSFTDPIFGMQNHQGNVPVYAITKLALNGLTAKLARELKETKIKVNSVCPGFVATYPGTEQWGARPVSEGAKSIVWAATLPESGPSGGFFRDGKRLNW
ncbi:SDR family NAD(P)-dependent oxidoreductase [Ulvibacterium sp.]|uniref:SDR family NAD(P)-dependent oxidoreductase n=1 Tax=Ulvibacterium sp. TaxID=2665914 RepID=UPI003CC666C2